MLFTLVPMLVAALGHFVLYRWAVACWPRLSRHRWVYVAVASPFLRWLFIYKHVTVAGTLQALVLVELLAVVLAAVPLALLRGVSRATDRTPKPKPDAPKPRPELTR